MCSLPTTFVKLSRERTVSLSPTVKSKYGQQQLGKRNVFSTFCPETMNSIEESETNFPGKE